MGKRTGKKTRKGQLRSGRGKPVVRAPAGSGSRAALRSSKARPARPIVAKRQAPERQVRIKPLDPVTKCGAGTSVEELYRVEERVDGRKSFHLVFRDHRGWYCEHGRDCVAVRDVRRRGARKGLTTKR